MTLTEILDKVVVMIDAGELPIQKFSLSHLSKTDIIDTWYAIHNLDSGTLTVRHRLRGVFAYSPETNLISSVDNKLTVLNTIYTKFDSTEEELFQQSLVNEETISYDDLLKIRHIIRGIQNA